MVFFNYSRSLFFKDIFFSYSMKFQFVYICFIFLHIKFDETRIFDVEEH